MDKSRENSGSPKTPLPTSDGRSKSLNLRPQAKIPYFKYLVDSGKFYIDKCQFEGVNIPENFTLSDAETGEIIDEFKKNSLSIPFKNHKIYISNVVKQLGTEARKMAIEKVLIYFPAKISDTYFNGIEKNDIIEVLNFLKEKGFLIFSDTEKIYNEIYVKDLDIKKDIKLKKGDKEQIKEYNKILGERFTGTAEQWKNFDSQKQGFGIQCWDRQKATITKPFFKFYDKSQEIKKDKVFFDTLDEDIKNELLENFIYRFEFTLKDKRFFDKYEISNRLADIHKVPQEKWELIAKSFLNHAFQKKTRKIDLGKLKLNDRIWANVILIMFQNNNMTKGQIELLWTMAAQNKSEKYQAKKHFERLWSITTTPNEYSSDMYSILERVGKWDKFFGII